MTRRSSSSGSGRSFATTRVDHESVVLVERSPVEGEVQEQYIDSGLAEEAEDAANLMFRHQLAHALGAQVTSLGDSRHLQQRVLGADVRIESARGAGGRISRDHRVRGEAVFLAIELGQVREAEVGLVRVRGG